MPVKGFIEAAFRLSPRQPPHPSPDPGGMSLPAAGDGPWVPSPHPDRLVSHHRTGLPASRDTGRIKLGPGRSGRGRAYSDRRRGARARGRPHCATFREPDLRLALRQLANTLLPYLALCALMVWGAVQGHGLLVLPLAVPAGGLLVRLFILQHDCGHGSFLSSRPANDWLGRALSLLTLTPYDSWKRAHALHHASTGDLSRRGTGTSTPSPCASISCCRLGVVCATASTATRSS